LLEEHKAKVVRKCPFTIQLNYECVNIIQPVSLGVDIGFENIGISATTEKDVLFEAKVKIRTDIVKLLSQRIEIRRTRRSRKTRYRNTRFLNRKYTKPKGWKAPSFRARLDSHVELIAKVHSILPIGKIIVEIASFDIQKIKNPEIKGAEYQQGEMLGFNNLKAYILCRDGHLCRCCKGKSGDKILRVHHLESRLTGGNAPNNLITLCDSCHTKYHNGLIDLKDIKRGNCYKTESCMTSMKNQLIRDLRSKYSEVYVTFGDKTKFTI